MIPAFYHKIKLEQYEENEMLRVDRDAVLDALEAGLEKMFEGKSEAAPTFKRFNQGSYAMNTGVKPLGTGEYDIDVGVELSLARQNHDAVTVKKLVRDALEESGEKAEIRRSCVTVFRVGYHVDLAIYASRELSGDRELHLAKGKENSGVQHRFWQISDPRGFQDQIANRFKDDDARQFRRCIRYLKRWRDENFSPDGSAAPIGIGLTAAAYHWFAVSKDELSRNPTAPYYDREALRKFVGELLKKFKDVWDYDANRSFPRLQVMLTVQPYSDLFEKMTGRQMLSFKTKLEELLASLEFAGKALEVHDACAELAKRFGEDFPVPDKEKTSTPTRPAVAGSGSSGCDAEAQVEQG